MTTIFDPAVLATLDVPTLLDVWAQADDAVHEAEVYQHAVAQAVEQAMQNARAEQATTVEAAAEYRGAVEWDEAELTRLKEHLSPEEWDAILTARRDPPPRKPNITKVKMLAKRGDPFRGIIEDAQRSGAPRLKLTRLVPEEAQT